MSDSSYSVIFTGTIEPGRDLDEVKQAVASRFKLPAVQVDNLFASPGVAVKQNLDEDTARKLQRAFAAIGVVVEVRSSEAAPVPESASHAMPAQPVKPESPEVSPPPVEHDPGGVQNSSDSTSVPGPASEPPSLPVELDEGGVEQPSQADAGGVAADPYAPPSAAVTERDDSNSEMHPPKRCSIGRSLGWLGIGWRKFMERPGGWLGLTIVFIMVYTVPNLLPIIGPLFALLMMIAFPVFMGGAMLAADHHHRTGNVEIGHLFQGFNKKLWPLVIIGLTYFISYLVIITIVSVLFFGVFGMSMLFTEDPDIEPAVMLVPVLLTALISLSLMVPMFMLIWFSPGLVVLNDCSASEAMKLSLSGCWRNMLPVSLYGIVYFILVMIGLMILLVGVLLVLPVFIPSMYASYREIYLD